MSGAITPRSAGVLLHPTSLPGGVIGDLGDAAYAFVDWLAEAGQSYWQILPLVAVDESGSPYNGLSALAGNPMLVSLDRLVEQGLLTDADAQAPTQSTERVHFPSAMRFKGERLARAYAAFRSGAAPRLVGELERYRAEHREWLDDYVLFRALRRAHQGASWTRWEPALRDREPAALQSARRELAEEVDQRIFQQFLFDWQWGELRGYAAERGIRIIGDIPIFVAHDSADVWAHPEIFQLDREGEPEVVSGVPPDYFSETGQRWGNPLYRWDVLRERDYGWWVERFRRALSWVDLLRIDHFRGFESYWEIPAEEETAVRGRWAPGPGAEFFRSVQRQLGPLPVIAEDLGLITKAVEKLREDLGFPGMRVLQFAFDGDPDNPHLPENYPPRSVAYTGTHDNDTVVGWWRGASDEERAAVRERTSGDRDTIHWELISLVLESDADLAVIPVQDPLGLGSDARMNTPGTTGQNWSWRLGPGELAGDAAARLRDLTERSGRAPRRS
jgi:4-alpha-glucanotransferase